MVHILRIDEMFASCINGMDIISHEYAPDFMKCISESIQDEDNVLYRVEIDYGMEDFLYEYLSKGKNEKTVKFDLIPASQYRNLLNRFMNAPTPDMARIPENVVDRWLEMTAKNFLKIVFMTELAGHSSNFPEECCEDAFGDDINWEDFGEACEYLEKIGFYDWCKLPDGSDGWSDYGIEPIYKIFGEYDISMDGAEKLLILNRILDVGHYRGDLASAFIEGGSRTCSAISGNWRVA